MTISRLLLVAIAVAVMLTAGSSPGRAQDKGLAYVVSYIEVAPHSRTAARALLRSLSKTSLKEPGNGGFEVLERLDRPQQFAILETWKDAKAQTDHAAAASTRQIRDKLKPLLVAPYDERLHFGFAVGSSQSPAGALYVLTHVDFVGPKKDEGLAALKQLSAESAKESGILRFDVLQQTNRPNHITLIGIWPSKAALEAHEQAAHTRKFRDELLPIGGALFDQRLYREK